ncbi:MAG: class I SAM-dependent methyltransferase [Pseudomonadota bacterium]
MIADDIHASRETLYSEKTAGYFSGARRDMVALLSTGPGARILEIGCGDGATGAVALAAGKADHYLGIELMPEVAEQARARLSEVITADVEKLELTQFYGKFDALIMSEVIEHLVDPWDTLMRLLACVKPGGEIVASSPNIAHRRVIGDLIAGRFEYADEGVMDRTHLRWFTPRSYRALFEGAGCIDVRVMPIRRPGLLPRIVNRLTRNRYAHLSMTQIMVHARKAT